MKYNTYWSIANVHWRSQDMFFCPSISKTVQLVLFLSFQLWLHHLVHADPPYESCNNTDEFAENGVFQSNLDQLLYSFKGNASALKFYNTTVGNFPDRVYGLFLCYMYVSNDACHECIATASQTVKNLCARKYEAVVWGEYCQLRYSNKSFFGSLDVADYTSQQNPRNISDPDQFRSDVNKTLTNLTNSSPFDYSDGIYATGNGVFPPNETIYALVQCTQDLSPDSCKECLTKSIAQVQNCCYFAMGARLLSRSCYLRYELYPINDWATGPHGSTQNPGGFKNKGMIAILATGSAAVLLGLLVFCYAMRKQTMKSNNVLPRESEIVSQEVQLDEIGEPKTMDFLNRNLQGRHSLNPQEFPFIDMETINTATEYFAERNKLGQGSFGPVYKGILSDGKEVAVKRLSELSDQGSDEFINEVLLILKLQHKNLVRLVGFCAHGEEKLLIYEYMPNNSLDFFLTDPGKRAQLNWSRRLSIINGIARGLLYLHQDSRLRIIHRDLKPSNVLLDKDMNPKISDFGMARIFGGSDGEANTARVAGTYGYMAPEYAMEGLYSFKSDVFSFGVLLLETITGRRNFVGFDLSKRTPSLIAYAWNFWIDGRGAELMDPLLTDSCNADEFLRYMHIGLLCVQEDAYDRPTMSTVAVMLKSETITLCQPERPAFSIGRFTDQYETCFNNLSMNNLTVSDVLPR